MRNGEGRRRHRISLVPTDEWMRFIEGFEGRRRTLDPRSCETAKEDEGIESALCPQTSGCASSKGSKVEEERLTHGHAKRRRKTKASNQPCAHRRVDALHRRVRRSKKNA